MSAEIVTDPELKKALKKIVEVCSPKCQVCYLNKPNRMVQVSIPNSIWDGAWMFMCDMCFTKHTKTVVIQ